MEEPGLQLKTILEVMFVVGAEGQGEPWSYTRAIFWVWGSYWGRVLALPRLYNITKWLQHQTKSSSYHKDCVEIFSAGIVYMYLLMYTCVNFKLQNFKNLFKNWRYLNSISSTKKFSSCSIKLIFFTANMFMHLLWGCFPRGPDRHWPLGDKVCHTQGSEVDRCWYRTCRRLTTLEPQWTQLNDDQTSWSGETNLSYSHPSLLNISPEKEISLSNSNIVWEFFTA